MMRSPELTALGPVPDGHTHRIRRGVNDLCAHQRGIRINLKGDGEQRQYKNDDKGFHIPVCRGQVRRNQPNKPAKKGRFISEYGCAPPGDPPRFGSKMEFSGIGGLRTYIRPCAGPSPARLPPRAASARPPSWGRFFQEGRVVGERRCAVGGGLSEKAAAVGSAFWPRGVIQPGPRLLFGPTGNSVAAGRSRARIRQDVATGLLRAMRRRGVGSSTQTDQEAQDQYRSHRVCSPATAHPQTASRMLAVTASTSRLIAPRLSLPATAYRTEYIADTLAAPDCDSVPEPYRGRLIDQSPAAWSAASRASFSSASRVRSSSFQLLRQQGQRGSLLRQAQSLPPAPL
jgi:hypothetical protein